jgi:hypothetical protein
VATPSTPRETAVETERRGAWRPWVARLLTVVGVLLITVSVLANWAERQVLDNNQFKDTARQLIADPAIQQQVATALTNELFQSVDIQAELERRLPEDQQALSGAIAGALRPVAERLVGQILERPRFEDVWVAAVGAAHEAAVRVLDDKAEFLETSNGVVAINLRPLLIELSQELPVVPNLAERIPLDAGVITLFKADELDTAQTVTRILRGVADWIWLPALAAWIAAVWIARDRRKEVRAIAIGFVAVGLLLLLFRRVAGRYVVDQLADSTANEDAVTNAWDIITQLLADAAWAVVAIGLIALLGVWLLGPGSRGTAVRRWLAPYLRQPGLTYGVAALLFALLLLWGPISYVKKPSTVLVLAVLSALGVETLRRTTAREAPGAVASEAFAGIRRSAERLFDGGEANELERLTGLKEKGALTDEEFAAAKAKLLGRE